LGLEISEGSRGVSGGQRQLIGFTRLLLSDPKVWLLDEPTGAMDSMTEARIIALLSELQRDGKTLIVSTHKSALLPLFSRLLVLQGCRVMLDGPRQAVLDHLSGRATTAAAAQASATKANAR
jgi:ATP-binding cassette subfamily C protein LapB